MTECGNLQVKAQLLRLPLRALQPELHQQLPVQPALLEHHQLRPLPLLQVETSSFAITTVLLPQSDVWYTWHD